MSKYNLLFLTGCMFCFVQGLTQTYEISYKVKVHKNKKNLIGVSDFAQAVFDEMDSLEMKLLFNKNKALFEYRKKKDFSREKQRIIRGARSLIVGVTHTYFTDLTQNFSYEVKYSTTGGYITRSRYSVFDWKLLNEHKQILGYKCYKAITNKKLVNRKGIEDDIEIIAWYTKEIPYPFGPKNYFGLPGAIMEIHEGKNRVSFLSTKLELKPAEKNITFIIPDGVEIINKE